MTKAPETPYGRLDRLVHEAAFQSMPAQKVMAELENDLFARDLRDTPLTAPVFIASLPRCGTTLLLNRLQGAAAFATQTYRDMPFLMTPLLWGRLTRPFRKLGRDRPRAHGDGMMVGYDSPEAFEEAFWRAYWPEHYAADRIQCWNAADARRGDFAKLLRLHMRKVILARQWEGGPAKARYLSKNNGNIARLPLLHALFPDAAILTPFRRPLDHARSLLEQHRRFLTIHREDPFARRYMAAIGHFDFGANLRLIDFEGWTAQPCDPLTLDYWLRYWIATFRSLAAAPRPPVFLSYDRLCAAPERSFGALAVAVGSVHGLSAVGVTPVRDRGEIDPRDPVDRGLRGEADALHAELLGRSIC